VVSTEYRSEAPEAHLIRDASAAVASIMSRTPPVDHWSSFPRRTRSSTLRVRHAEALAVCANWM